MPSTSCISCGYSLDGLARESLCPECAFPVARSLDATPLLRTAEPRWLVRIASGLRDLHRSMSCWLVAICLLIVVAGIGLFALTLNPGNALLNVMMVALHALMILAPLSAFFFASYGLWAVGSPTPSFHCPPAWARLTVRWCSSSLLLITIVIAAFNAFYNLSTLGTPAVYTLRAAVQVAGMFSLLAFSRLMEHFERSLPDPRPDLSKRAKSTRQNIAVLAVIFAIGWWQTLYSTRAVTGMPLGFAPILLTIGFLCFERTITRTYKGITAELAAANPGGMLKSS